MPSLSQGIYSVENKYGGLRYNPKICKYIHVKEWSCMEIYYMKNILSSIIIGTSVTAFVRLWRVSSHLNSNIYHTIMYPCGTNISGTKLLICNYSNSQFNRKVIHSNLEFFFFLTTHTHSMIIYQYTILYLLWLVWLYNQSL